MVSFFNAASQQIFDNKKSKETGPHATPAGPATPKNEGLELVGLKKLDNTVDGSEILHHLGCIKP